MIALVTDSKGEVRWVLKDTLSRLKEQECLNSVHVVRITVEINALFLPL